MLVFVVLIVTDGLLHNFCINLSAQHITDVYDNLNSPLVEL